MKKIKRNIPTVNKLIKSYNILVKGIEQEANENEERAYGGIIRASKGLLVEGIARNLIRIAWQELNGNPKSLSLEKKTVKIPIKPDYINKIKSPEVKKFISKNIKDFFYVYKADVNVYINNKFKVAIECKTYTENAMIKRILVDFTLLKQVFPDVKCVLLQLESQLGGDYSKINKNIILGSKQTHTLMSYFDVDLNIITLLEGERKVDQPIHKKSFFKELKKESLLKTICVFKKLIAD